MQIESVDGSMGPIIEYDPEKLLEALNSPKVKEVHVFNLKPGMEVEIKDKKYKLNSINSKGKKLIAHFTEI